MLAARTVGRLGVQQRAQLLLRPRFNSSSAARGAAEGAQAAASKAQEAASKAWTSASASGAKLFGAARNATGGLGERVAGLLGSYREPVLYNLAVAREVLKQVYLAENLRPPTSLDAITGAYKTAFNAARSPAWWRETLRSGYWAKLGVYAVEAYGIFKIGEIIGRRKLVGYKLQQ